jgi:hypothetical protein
MEERMADRLRGTSDNNWRAKYYKLTAKDAASSRPK